ncbi:MAG: hypothetical protein EBR09_06890 [Proteobacteria bacterium]|nr:hypothetical protein [Pseudomonadota bacterium]
MKMNSRGSIGLSAVLCLASAVSCGTPEDNLAQLKPAGSKPDAGPERKNSTDDELGFNRTNVAGGYNEWWDLSDDSGNPLLYRPDNFDVAMSAFTRINVKSTKQMCSGVKIYERQSSGKFNIYLMTAKHCFVEIDPLGRLRSGGAGSKHSFDANTFSPSIDRPAKLEFIYKYKSQSGKQTAEQPYGKKRLYNSANAAESFSDIAYTTYRGSSDVVRLLIKADADEQTAKRSALPVCSRSLLPDAVDEESREQTRIFLPMVYESREKRVHLERMIGKHKYEGVAPTGMFAANSTAGIHKLMTSVIQSLNLDENGQRLQGTSTIVYSNNRGVGVEASDSGAPVLVGTRVAPASFISRFSLYVFPYQANHFMNKVVVNSIDCVAGVISRELRVSEFDVSSPADSRMALSSPLSMQELKDAGTWTSSLIVTAGDNPNDWF